MIGLIAGILIIVVIAYALSRIIKEIAVAVIAIIAIFLASSLIFKEAPYIPWDKIPVVGPYLEEKFGFPEDFSQLIVKVRNIFYNVEIIGVDKLSNGNIAVVIVNSGKLDQSGAIELYFDNKTVSILNKPEKLESGKVYILETSVSNWPNEIKVVTEKSESVYVIEE